MKSVFRYIRGSGNMALMLPILLNQMLGDTGNVYAPGSGHVVYFRTG